MSNTVTASIDRLDFLGPVFVGDLLFLKASLNMAGKTSMELGVRVEAENLVSGEVRHTSSAYLTFVALDENGKPRAVPALILETRRRDPAEPGGADEKKDAARTEGIAALGDRAELLKARASGLRDTHRRF